MARSNSAVQALIKQRYWPRLDEDGKIIAPNPDGVYGPEAAGEYDPDVVWVGSMVDGLIRLQVFTDRVQAKTFGYEAGDKPHWFEFRFERCIDRASDLHPYTGSKYTDPLTIRAFPGAAGDTVDPGETKNSPKRGGTSEDDLWASAGGRVFDAPEITIDRRFGLHILRKGDRVTKKWKHPNRPTPITEIYVLRPLSEGTSRVQVAQANRQTVL